MLGADVFDQAKSSKHARPTSGKATLLGDIAVNLQALDELSHIGALGPGGAAKIGHGKTAKDAHALPHLAAHLAPVGDSGCHAFDAGHLGFPFKVGLVVKKRTVGPILFGDGLQGVELAELLDAGQSGDHAPDVLFGFLVNVCQ